MEITDLTAEHIPAMAAVVRRNPWRIFCRGIFMPCADVTEEDIAAVFAPAQGTAPDFGIAVTCDPQGDRSRAEDGTERS